MVRRNQFRTKGRCKFLNQYRIMIVDDESDILDLLEKDIGKEKFRPMMNWIKYLVWQLVEMIM